MSLSQHGEYEIIVELFKEIGMTNKYLVDVGALGKFLSNTWDLLSQGGWKGLLIDADLSRRDIIRHEFEGMDVEVVGVGVSDFVGEMDFYLHNIIGHNSFVKGWYASTETGASIKVMVRPLADILTEKSVPFDFDFLSIDTEGMDERIIKKLFSSSEYRPRVIVTECTPYSGHGPLFGEYGYSLYRKVGNKEYGNLIYVKR